MFLSIACSVALKTSSKVSSLGFAAFCRATAAFGPRSSGGGDSMSFLSGTTFPCSIFQKTFSLPKHCSPWAVQLGSSQIQRPTVAHHGSFSE